MSDNGSSDGKEPAMSEADITKEIEDKCYKAFIDFDREGNGGQINSDQVAQVLEQMEVKMSDQEIYKLISEIDPENTGSINFSQFKQLIVLREVERLMGEDESELLDAFVAMGGDPDGEGCVDAKKLIRTIKEEF